MVNFENTNTIISESFSLPNLVYLGKESRECDPVFNTSRNPKILMARNKI